jgi:hypothetical protein
MGELQGTLFSLDFNRSIQVEARRERLTADAGVLLMRELSETLGVPGLVSKHLNDPRDASRITHPFLELLHTRVLALAQGWGDQNDVGLLQADPAFRLAVSERRGDAPLRTPESDQVPDGLCSQPTLSRLLQTLGTEGNRAGLAHILRAMVRSFLGLPRREITLDLDSLPLEVHGHQPGSAYNGHYRIRCYHPLVASVGGRFFLGASLREGNVHTADGGLDFVLPLLRWLRTLVPRVWLRADAGFPQPAFLDALETDDVPYVCRIRSNATLDRLAAPFLRRPPGRPPSDGRTWFHELRYQAASWSRERRVVLVVLERSDEQQHLFLDHFFLLTSAAPEEENADALLQRYRLRGCAEADFGDWTTALAPALSSTPRTKTHYRGLPIPGAPDPCDSFAANEAELLLSLIAANLLAAGAELLRRDGHARMSRDRFRTFLLKTAGRVLLGRRRVTFVIDAARAHLWQRFRSRLLALHPPRGSPAFQALPAQP